MKKKDGIDNRDIPISHAEYMNKKQITSFTKQRTLIIEVLTITMNRNVLETILISFLQVHLPRIIIFFFFFFFLHICIFILYFLSIARIPKKNWKQEKKISCNLATTLTYELYLVKKKGIEQTQYCVFLWNLPISICGD